MTQRRIACLALVVAVAVAALVGCGDSQPDICAKVKSQFSTCSKDAPRGAFDEIHKTCAKVVQRGQRDRSGQAFKAMFDDCANSQSCADFSGCFARHGCQLAVTDPEDTTLKFMCDLAMHAED